MQRLTPNQNDTRVSLVQQRTFLYLMGALFQGPTEEEIVGSMVASAYRAIGHTPEIQAHKKTPRGEEKK